MKKPFPKAGLFAAAGLAFLMCAGPAAAESITARMTVPFQFYAGDKLLPAGSYVVRFNPDFRTVEISSKNARTTLRPLTNWAYRDRAGIDEGRLMFQKYGSVHVLWKMWNPGELRGYELPSPKLDQAVTQATPSVVSLGGSGNQ